MATIVVTSSVFSTTTSYSSIIVGAGVGAGVGTGVGVEEGGGVLSARHGLPLDDLHVQAQRRDIFEAIEIENSQKPFSLVTLIWDNTGMPNLPILASVEGTNVC